MYLEERLDDHEKQNAALARRLDELEKANPAAFVTPAELARIMKCTPQNINNKIRRGVIQVTRLAGDPRIPMAQFYEPAKAEKGSMAEAVFR